MPVRRTQTPAGIPGFNTNKCEVCGVIQYAKKMFATPDGKARCKKHRHMDDDNALFDKEQFNPDA